MSDANGSQKAVSESLELESQKVMSHQGAAKNQTQVLHEKQVFFIIVPSLQPQITTFLLSMYVGSIILHMWGGQRTACRSWFSLSTMWFQGLNSGCQA